MAGESIIMYIPQRCLFCVKMLPSSDGDMDKSKNSLKSCDHVWRYFIGKCEEKRLIKFRSISNTIGDNEKAEDVPQMCEVCEDKVAELDKLHRELQNKVMEMKELLVMRSRKYWEELKRNAEWESTIQVLEELRKGASSLSGPDACWESQSFTSEPFGSIDLDMEPPSSSIVIPEGVEIKMEPEDEDDDDNNVEMEGSLNLGDETEVEKKVFKDEPKRRKYPTPVRPLRKRRRRASSKRKVPAGRQKPKRPAPPREKPEGPKFNGHNCDICRVRIPYTEIVEHLQGHVKDYVVRCPNPGCTYACSNPLTLERYHIKFCSKKTPANCRNEARSNKLIKLCDVCGFETDTLSTFRVHLRVHDNEENFECPVTGCGKKFGARQGVAFHINSHTKHEGLHEDLPCFYCKFKRQTYSAKEMEVHLRKKHGAKKNDLLHCYLDGCSHPFMNRDDLVSHLKKRHEDREGHPCDLCGDGMKHRSLHRHYLETHNIGRRFQCEFCPKVFSNSPSLRSHKLNHHRTKLEPIDSPIDTTKETKKEKTIYTCKECANNADDNGDGSKIVYSTSSYAQLMTHMQRHHGVNKGKTYSCSSCPYREFVTRRELQEHMERAHGDKSKFPCGIDGCQYSYSSRVSLKVHRNRHHSNEPRRRHQCDQCEKTYAKLKDLKQHHATVHEGKEPPKVICIVCGGKYSEKFMSRHMLRHQGIKRFKCDKCDVSFVDKRSLLKHLTIHPDPD